VILRCCHIFCFNIYISCLFAMQCYVCVLGLFRLNWLKLPLFFLLIQKTLFEKRIFLTNPNYNKVVGRPGWCFNAARIHNWFYFVLSNNNYNYVYWLETADRKLLFWPCIIIPYHRRLLCVKSPVIGALYNIIYKRHYTIHVNYKSL